MFGGPCVPQTPDQKYRNQQLLYFTFASCYGAYLLYTAYGAALLSLALDHVF